MTTNVFKKDKRIVIIGAGFAGLQLARKLNNSDFDVVLIDKLNHHMFQPLFYQVAAGRIEPSNISFPLRKIFQYSKNVQILMDDVKRISPEEHFIETTNDKFNYDYLIIASGCQTNYFGNKNLEQYTCSMKSTYQAINIRNKLLTSLEKAAINPQSHKELLTWVIVGAGPTGVELAGSFAEMKSQILPVDFKKVDFSGLRIILLEGGNCCLKSMSEVSQLAAKKYLSELGVEIMFDKVVENYDGHILHLSGGEIIKTENIIWTAGVKGNLLQGIPQSSVISNRYKVDRFNKIENCNDVFAIGDIAYMVTPNYPNAHPQVANVAINQAKNLGNNLLKFDAKENWKQYEYQDLGSMATVGKYRAVVELPFAKFQGRLAWFIWMFLHLMLILSVRNKLKIFINWAYNYFTKDSALRLILKEPEQNKN